MRRLVVLVTLLALAVPLAASAAVRSPGDGTLAVRDLDGRITVWARGAVIGRCDQCTLVLDEKPGAEEIAPVVSGTRGVDIDEDLAKERFVGTNLRWKVIGGSFRMWVRNAKNADISVVGRGRVIVIAGTNGSFVLNDQPELEVLPDLVAFPLSATAIIP